MNVFFNLSDIDIKPIFVLNICVFFSFVQRKLCALYQITPLKVIKKLYFPMDFLYPTYYFIFASIFSVIYNVHVQVYNINKLTNLRR